MRNAASALLALLILSACQTQEVRRPIDPEAVGLHAKMQPTTDEAKQLEQEAIAALGAIFGQPLPAELRLDGSPTGWFTDNGKLRQLRASAELPRLEFYTRTALKGWHEIPIPEEYLTAMHLSPSVPRAYMTCYVGQVNNRAAYLLWSALAGTVLLVLDY